MDFKNLKNSGQELEDQENILANHILALTKNFEPGRTFSMLDLPGEPHPPLQFGGAMGRLISRGWFNTTGQEGIFVRTHKREA